jgi:hypothetical protein
MNNNQASKDFLKFTIKILSLSTLIVWVSSYVQLSFFGNFDPPKPIKIIGSLWGGGVAIDSFSLFCCTLMGAFLKKNQSPVEGVGWIFYFFSHAVYAQPLLFGYKSGPLLTSLIKVGEFLIFSFFHIICVIIIPAFVEKYIDRTSSRE